MTPGMSFGKYAAIFHIVTKFSARSLVNFGFVELVNKLVVSFESYDDEALSWLFCVCRWPDLCFNFGLDRRTWWPDLCFNFGLDRRTWSSLRATSVKKVQGEKLRV